MEQKQDAKHKVKATYVAFLGPKVMTGKVMVGSLRLLEMVKRHVSEG